MEETANSVSRSCWKCRVKRKARLNKLSHAHLAGFIVSSLWSLACITQMLLIFDFMESKGGMGACSLPAFPLPEFHWACQRQGGGGIEEIRGVAVLSSWPTLASPYFFPPPQSLSSCGTFLCFPSTLPVSPVVRFFVFERQFWPRIVSISAFQGWICALIVQTITTVLEISFFYWPPQAFRCSRTVWAKSANAFLCPHGLLCFKPVSFL